MSLTVKTPGVYIQEVNTLPASVVPVETAIPAFVGYTETDPGKVVKIRSMVEFEQNFGGPNISLEVNVDVTSSGVSTISSTTTNTLNDYLYYAMQMYFVNGGGDCYVCSCGDYNDTPATSHYTAAFNLIEKEDEPTLLVMPDAVRLGTGGSNYGLVATEALSQAGTLQDRFAILDTPTSSTIATDATNIRSDVGTEDLKYGAVYYPWLNTGLTLPDSAVQVNITLAGGSSDIGDYSGDTLATIRAAALTESDATLKADVNNMLNQIGQDMADAAAAVTITVPPSSAVAGIYATVDRTRGVWKAPANISLRNVESLTVTITDDDQADLNVTSTGKSINAIRKFTGKGTLVWGARTLAGNDNEWRYVPVRRLYIMAEESIKKATEFVVFEPNDANTWTRVRAMIENFLTVLWRQGALAGATPEQAFFVNVGLGETMTAQDILEGRLIIDVGMAAVRPAEFIILRFSHKLQES